MPHAFKAHPNHPAVEYLVRLHADIGGRIQQNKREAEKLADDMRHVEAVIKMFDPDYSVRAISARRRENHFGKTVERVGEGKPTHWRLKSDCATS